MYSIKTDICDKLLDQASENGFPKRKTIEKYKNGDQKAREITVRALAAHLKEEDWKELVS